MPSTKGAGSQVLDGVGDQVARWWCNKQGIYHYLDGREACMLMDGPSNEHYKLHNLDKQKCTFFYQRQ
jgi:hypothetical protein